MTSKVLCPCGSSINHNYIRFHIYSKKHLNFISNNPLKDYSDIYNEDLLDNLNETMNKLDENKSEMKEIDYLNQCNNILKEYNENKINSIKKSYFNLLLKFNENKRLYNKIISEITYKNNSVIHYQYYNYKYFNYYLIENNIIIVKIDYLKYILY
jgi:hypothetical protein